jgi:hypothetical protein
MPLLDHFHAPIKQRRTWEGFFSLWAAAIVETLNRDVLSSEFFADMQVHIGGALEVDVATLRERVILNSTATPKVWQPPAPTMVIPTVFPDEIGVQVFSTSAGATLVAAIEMVSPANKVREETRKAFPSKCIGFLTRGIGLVVVDVVTNRLANLHNELIAQLDLGESFAMAPGIATYCVAYQPVRTRRAIESTPGPSRWKSGTSRRLCHWLC